MTQYSATILKPIAIVWEHFIFKIEHPEHFVPGVSQVVILEKTDDYVMRKMDLSGPTGIPATITEKITWAPYWVKFLIVDHPLYTGYVDNLAESISDTETRITYTINWVNKTTQEPFNNEDIPKNAVLKTIDYILKSH